MATRTRKPAGRGPAAARGLVQWDLGPEVTRPVATALRRLLVAPVAVPQPRAGHGSLMSAFHVPAGSAGGRRGPHPERGAAPRRHRPVPPSTALDHTRRAARRDDAD